MNKSLLHPDHYADLKEKSGLSDETIQQAEIKTIPPHQINKLIGFNVPDLISAYEIPYGNGFSRIKAFYEKGKEFYANGKRKPKYLQKKDSGNRLYIPKILGEINSDK